MQVELLIIVNNVYIVKYQSLTAFGIKVSDVVMQLILDITLPARGLKAI